MSSKEIQQKLQNLIEDFSKDRFIYNFLLAYGTAKSVVTRLEKGDFNLSKNKGEVFYKKKLFFRIESNEKLLSSIDDISKDDSILRHKPRFAIVTDYKQLVAKDLKLGKNLDIPISELANHYDFFLPLAGSEVYNSSNDNQADRNAAYKLAQFYDFLIEENPKVYDSLVGVHNLNLFLSRLLFCFFAEDTGIFPEDSLFTNTLAQHTNNNGHDTHSFLDELFLRLNKEDSSTFPAFLAQFPYVNGGLFSGNIPAPKFSSKARRILIELGDLQWKDINPDVFGSMIQAVVTEGERSNFGKHYTSVPNILKLIKPLFLDELYEEYENAQTVQQLQKLLVRISTIKFFDPACGSGNFLIIIYKEIRSLEIKVIQKIIELSDSLLQIYTTQIKLSQFYGIEIDDFAHEIAMLSLWLAEHQMNMVFEDSLYGYGESEPILPLKQAGKIAQGNATRLNWNDVCHLEGNEEVYVVGNPPYLGSRYQKENHRQDMKFVLKSINDYKRLDYITCWFYKGVEYIKDKNAKVAFVSTNSICQGEQVTPIWSNLLKNGIEIGFCYKSFTWKNNAKGNAGVTVIIVGLRNISKQDKFIFDDNVKQSVKEINGYLQAEDNLYLKSRRIPISKIQNITRTNPALDNGYLLLNEQEKASLVFEYPKSAQLIKPVVGAAEFLQGKNKYCLWITDELLEAANDIPPIRERINLVRDYRLNRDDTSSNNPAKFPHRFLKMKLAKDSVLFLPTVSSIKRHYIPCGFFDNDTVIIDPNFAVYDPEPITFAILSSRMHMVWVRKFSGKMKTDYRYSSTLCYNTFPFPDISTARRETLSQYVFDIIDARANHTGKTIAWMYDPETMPQDLKHAHESLDAAIEQCYRLKPFTSDSERLDFLFALYEKMIKEEDNKIKAN